MPLQRYIASYSNRATSTLGFFDGSVVLSTIDWCNEMSAWPKRHDTVGKQWCVGFGSCGRNKPADAHLHYKILRRNAANCPGIPFPGNDYLAANTVLNSQYVACSMNEWLEMLLDWMNFECLF